MSSLVNPSYSISFSYLQTLRRRRHAHPLVVGIVSTVNSVPHIDPTVAAKPEEYNFSLLVNSKDSTLEMECSLLCMYAP